MDDGTWDTDITETDCGNLTQTNFWDSDDANGARCEDDTGGEGNEITAACFAPDGTTEITKFCHANGDTNTEVQGCYDSSTL